MYPILPSQSNYTIIHNENGIRIPDAASILQGSLHGQSDSVNSSASATNSILSSWWESAMPLTSSDLWRRSMYGCNHSTNTTMQSTQRSYVSFIASPKHGSHVTINARWSSLAFSSSIVGTPAVNNNVAADSDGSILSFFTLTSFLLDRTMTSMCFHELCMLLLTECNMGSLLKICITQ